MRPHPGEGAPPTEASIEAFRLDEEGYRSLVHDTLRLDVMAESRRLRSQLRAQRIPELMWQFPEVLPDLDQVEAFRSQPDDAGRA